jgi:hypothetical protein
MSAFRIRKGWVRLISSLTGALFLTSCVTDAQFRDFASTTLVRTFWTTVARFAQAVFIDQQQNAPDQGG